MTNSSSKCRAAPIERGLRVSSPRSPLSLKCILVSLTFIQLIALQAFLFCVLLHSSRGLFTGLWPNVILTDDTEGPDNEGFGQHANSSSANNNKAGKPTSSSQAVIPKHPTPNAMESITGAIDVAAKYSFPPNGGVIKITNVSYIYFFKFTAHIASNNV